MNLATYHMNRWEDRREARRPWRKVIRDLAIILAALAALAIANGLIGMVRW